VSRITLFVALLFPCAAAFAQAPEGPIPPSVNPLCLRFLPAVEADKPFSATLLVTTVYGGQPARPEAARLAVVIAPPRVRATIELAALPQMTAAQRQDLKRNGMDRLVAIGLLDEKRCYFIYPSLRSYVDLELKEGAGRVVQTSTAVSASIDGTAFAKREVVVADAQGREQTLIVWSPRERPGIPFRIEASSGAPGTPDGRTSVLQFEDVKLEPTPDASVFAAPPDYRRFQTLLAFETWVAEKIPVPKR
jgi:hypothetical protein